MSLMPLLAVLIGAIIAVYARVQVDPKVAPYMALACLAGLDTLLGGIRSAAEGQFKKDVFVTGFISNVLFASFLAWLGDQIYINLLFAVALVLGARIFNNLSLIRRHLLTRYQDYIARKRELAAQQTQAATTTGTGPEVQS